MLEEIFCPHCQQKAWSVADINYIRLFGTCWYCDKDKWERGIMKLEVFEEREKRAAQAN